MGICRAEISHISIQGPILPPMKRGTFLPRSSKYGVCTDLGNTFLDSPCPKLPFHITIALVQTPYHGDFAATLSIRAEISHISILGPILPSMKWGTLLPRRGKYGIFTN